MGSFEVEEITDFSQGDLEDDDAYILDCYAIIFVWVGGEASETEKAMVLETAAAYVAIKCYAADTPVVTVAAGAEPRTFTANFLGWNATAIPAYVDPYAAKLAAMKLEQQALLEDSEASPTNAKALAMRRSLRKTDSVHSPLRGAPGGGAATQPVASPPNQKEEAPPEWATQRERLRKTPSSPIVIAAADGAAIPDDALTAVELVLKGGDTLLAELSAPAGKAALTQGTADLLGVEAKRVRLELSAGSVVVKAAVAGGPPGSRSAKEAAVALLKMDPAAIVSKLSEALGDLVSSKLELKGAPCEITPGSIAAAAAAPGAGAEGTEAVLKRLRSEEDAEAVMKRLASPAETNSKVGSSGRRRKKRGGGEGNKGAGVGAEPEPEVGRIARFTTQLL